ncbi:hypothetical protein DE146DRAFT_790101 [Phaeosphaeria sp. MPI-PUGE-AT-0046c]|nr:hypothetical protein DE146DRAFT_790101 [Phaeosphaeria sp. MPI-PUGE-AT-0046c]
MSDQTQHRPASTMQSSTRHTDEEIQAAHGLLMLFESTPQQEVSALPASVDGEVSNAARVLQQMSSDDYGSASAQSYVDVQPNRVQPSAKLRKMAIEYLNRDANFASQPLQQPKHGKQSKVAKFKRATSLHVTTADDEEVDNWQPPIPLDDGNDNDYKPPTHLKRGKSDQEASIVDELSDYIPSAENDFDFKHGSPSGRTASQLDDLLKVHSRPKKFPQDLKRRHQLSLSHNQLETMPRAGLADELVRKIEKAHVKDVKGYDDA